MTPKSADKQIDAAAYYSGIDVLRFASALMVAIFHLLFWSWAGVNTTIDQTNHIFAGAAQFPSAVRLTWFGWVGVEVFFVISGFVITNSAIRASPMQFLTGRMLRLYPAVWTCATATLAALYFIAGDPLSILLGPYVKSLLLLPRPRWIDGVYWSLAVEITFYALVFCILLLKRFSVIHRAAWVLTIFSGVFNASNLAADLGAIPLSDFVQFLNSQLVVLVLLLLPHGCLFALGIWLWLAANNRMTTARWVGLAVALVASGTEVYARALEFVSSIPAATGQSPLVPVAILATATLVIAVSTRGGIFHAASGRTRTFLRYVGLVTYPLYLIHNLVGAGISRLLIGAGLNPWLAVFLVLGGLLGLCWLFCWRIEPAIRNLLRQILTNFEDRMLRPRRALGFLFTN